MPIPLSQLETWSHQGAVSTSSRAYASIQHALTKSTSPLASRDVEIFLQGSYANATNIHGDSDVDVVLMYRNTFCRDLSALTETRRQLHESIFPPATYRWSNLKDDALAALRSHYGNAAVTMGKKSIKVNTGIGSKPADVVPAVQFRRYASFTDRDTFTAHWGVQFFDSSSNPIANYPKYHIDRGQAKNQALRTGGRYKPTVRLVKNLRTYLVDNNLLADRIAPSYFLECALYNVPDSTFVGSFDNTLPNILDYLWTTPYANFYCQNGVIRLIGSSPTQWHEDDFATFLQAARNAWQDW